MIKYLEDLLHEKTKDTQSGILFAQWNYDKKIIPSALQAVSTLFPHYSLHDESHSLTIINNIVRVFGKENIAKLSAIDIWLILEASYCHDIGMVVSSDKLNESINSPKFIAFFRELINDPKNGLHEFAIQFDIIEDKIRFKSDLFNLELNDGIKFILAEFYRRMHAERSSEIINNPLQELSLISPRGVIPPRIFKILGDVCSCHTKEFSDVLNLPFSEVGIDVEDAHPRFIACLLRVGDLLDLDNNRFSEVMLRTLTKVPVDTLNHKAKHLSIESFRVDKDIIEITANCKDYETANITQHWFNYLNSEVSNQMTNWNKIVPFKELGYLPTIGQLKVVLSNYDLIDGKHKPKFSVDTDKALSLLQGAGIYDGAYQCIREVLQNAVDASLMRIWLEHGNTKDFHSPQSSDFVEIVKNYPISIIITEKGVTEEWQNWEIEIEDKGTGISTNDLKFLMNTGSSSKNRERIEIIEKMPTWLKPSGTFGIGFQSIFMLTDVVKIETKSFFTEEFQTIELNSPNSKKDGDILIQKKKTTHAIKPGSKIFIYHKTKAIPDGYTVSFEHKNAMRIARNFDPFSHESLDIELGKVLDEIFNFAHKCYLPISLKVDNSDIPIQSSIKQFDYFDSENSMELKIHYGNEHERWRCLTYFKNQEAKNDLETKFLGFEINIHKDKASDVLTLNRNEVKKGYRNVLYKDFLRSSYNIITENFNEIFISDKSKCYGSMYLHYYFNNENNQSSLLDKFQQWQNFEIELLDTTSMKIMEIFSSIKRLKLIYEKVSTGKGDIYDLSDPEELKITFSSGSISYDYTKFFLFKANSIFTSFTLDNSDNGQREIIYSKEPQESPIFNIDIGEILKRGDSSSARMIIPCTKEFFTLRIKDNAHASYVFPYVFDYNISKIPFPKMMSPFVREKTGREKSMFKKVINDKLLDWVFNNRFDIKTTKEQIESSYKDFCGKIDIEAINKSLTDENDTSFLDD